MNTLEILTAARAKIADEKNWCQNDYARSAVGELVIPTEDSACSWCSLGSIFSVVGSMGASYVHSEFLGRYMDKPITIFNDSHTHAEVLAAWDKAIAECAKETQ